MNPAVVVSASLGVLIGGPLLGLAAISIPFFLKKLHRRQPEPPRRLVLMLLIVELRAGNSVLGALQNVSTRLPDYRRLAVAVRVAGVSGLIEAIDHSGESLRPVMVQLARAQRSGAALADTVRRLLEKDLSDDRARRLASARALPVKLMLPVTLLMLPGLVLMIYGPTLLETLDELTGGLL